MKKTLMALGVLSLVSCGIDTVSAMNDRVYFDICSEKEQMWQTECDQKLRDTRVERYFEMHGDDLRNLFKRAATCEKAQKIYTDLIKLDQMERLCNGSLDIKGDLDGGTNCRVLTRITWKGFLLEGNKGRFCGESKEKQIKHCWLAYTYYLDKELVERHVKNFLQSILNRCIDYCVKYNSKFTVKNVMNESLSAYFNWAKPGCAEMSNPIDSAMEEYLNQENNFAYLERYTEDFLLFLLHTKKPLE